MLENFNVRVFDGEDYVNATAIGMNTPYPVVTFEDGTTVEIDRAYVENA